MSEVYITRVSGFLPHEPVLNEDMEARLGFIDGKASRARRIVLRNNGIRQRYYALDADGNSTHTNADLVHEAILGLVGNGLELKDVEVLACGTSAPDQVLPSHASMVHGLLPRAMEVVSPSGACCSGMHAFKYGFMSVGSGASRNAVATGSELISPMMLARNFEPETERFRQLESDPYIGFEKEFLRWMLSDGAAAVLLEPRPRGELDLKVEWVVARSFAHELDVCMYAGGDKDQEGRFHGWKTFAPEEFAGRSLFSMKQDTKLLAQHIVGRGSRFLAETLQEKGIDVASVDHMLVHLSSLFFRDKVREGLIEAGVDIPLDRWFINLPEVGNVGSASIFLQLHDLVRSGQLRKGQRILLMVPESARFSYAFSLLTVV
ncbi:MAG: beta-ketoacyl-ACP synthase III [Flavobacteriales bacterium]|nr:beta-ketoacyl-ACP synthase III [Flavobacteriales bacterium]